MKKIIAIILLIFMASAAYFYKDKLFTKNKSHGFERPPEVVTAYTVSPQDIPLNINSFGFLSAKLFTNYSSETAGIVIKIDFTAGDKVLKGKLLYQLDDGIPKARVAQAEAQLNLARLDKERYEKLHKQKAVSQQDMDKAENAYKQALANVDLSKAQLGQTRIRAPFDGIVGASNVKLGDYISPGKVLVTITNNKNLELEYKVADKYLNLLKLDQRVLFTIESYPKRKFNGTVDYVAAYVDHNTHAVSVRAKVDNTDLMLSPGVSAKIKQQLKIEKDAMTVPTLALNADIEGYYVFKIENNKALRAKVKTGQHLLDNVQIVSGLKIGDVVVVEGGSNLSNGSAVKIVDDGGKK